MMAHPNTHQPKGVEVEVEVVLQAIRLEAAMTLLAGQEADTVKARLA